MHETAMKHGAAFFEKYGPFQTIVEIGSMEVAGGSLRDAAKNYVNYLGVDCEPGDGVDVVASDPYRLPIVADYADAVVSSSTFEHADFFWLTFLEMCRIAKPGDGVDVVASDPYRLPIVADYADAVVSSSTFEHADFFWLTFLEMCRICKPGGHLYVNAPSNGYVHRHPVDCWRFYPDAGQALTKWAKRNGYEIELLQCFIGEPDPDVAKWQDFVGIWRKQ